MISDKELWIAANMVVEQHGEDAPLHVAERIGILALQGDRNGIAIWKAIAHRVDQLTKMLPDVEVSGRH